MMNKLVFVFIILFLRCVLFRGERNTVTGSVQEKVVCVGPFIGSLTLYTYRSDV